MQTVKRRVPTVAVHCPSCGRARSFVDVADLASLFEVSIAEAVLQFRRRRIHMRHLSSGVIAVCTESLLMRTEPDSPMLTRTLPPPSAAQHITFSQE